MKYVMIILLVSLLFSCVKKEEPRQLTLDRALEVKVEGYKKKKARRCTEEMMEEITIEVDSIMFFLVSQMNGETDIMPSRPPRPGRLVDTIALESLEN